MSAEFDDFVTALAGIAPEIEDATAFTIAEREAIDLMLDSFKVRNQRLLTIAERGRAPAPGRRAA